MMKKQSTQAATTVALKHIQSMLEQLDIQSSEESAGLIGHLKKTTIKETLSTETTEMSSKTQEQLLSQLSPPSQTMGMTIGINNVENSKNKSIFRFPQLTPEKCRDFLDTLSVDIFKIENTSTNKFSPILK